MTRELVLVSRFSECDCSLSAPAPTPGIRADGFDRDFVPGLSDADEVRFAGRCAVSDIVIYCEGPQNDRARTMLVRA